MSLRDKALKKFKRSGIPSHWDEYKSLRNYTSSAVKKEKKAYFEYKLRSPGRRNIWKDLRDLNIYKRPNVDIPDHLLNAEELNKYFCAVSNAGGSPDPDVINFYKNNVKPGVDSFSFMETSDAEVESIINHLSSCSCGVDSVSLRMLALCCPTLLPILSHLFNFCLTSNVFPCTWKTARVIPIPKNNRPTSFTDLRPISILPVLSKILERLVERQLRDHISSFHLLPGTQSGFRPGFSCASALANITDDIISATDLGQVTVLVLLDFSKAFDTINHDLLLSILHFIGMGPDAISFFESYLTDRTQRVFVGTSSSDIIRVEAGVPQGSILGPLLFSIYTSHLFLFHNFYCSYHLYADDTQLYSSFSPENVRFAIRRMNLDLQNLFNIATRHCLSINEEKSCCIVFGNAVNRSRVLDLVKLYVNGAPLVLRDNVRNLGLHIDSKLKFKNHIDLCIRRAYCSLKMLYPHRHTVSVAIKKQLCDSLVLSHFNFCDTVYGSCLDQVDVRRIQVAQNSCLRFIFGIRRKQRISYKLLELGWLNMIKRRKLHFLCFVYKIVNNNVPPYLTNKIRFRTDVHNVNIRRKDIIDIPRHHTQQFKRGFKYHCASMLNQLPVSVKQCNYVAFRRSILDLLMNEQYLAILK